MVFLKRIDLVITMKIIEDYLLRHLPKGSGEAPYEICLNTEGEYITDPERTKVKKKRLE